MDNVLVTSMDIPPASHEMWLSDDEGWVTHRDLREDKSKQRAYQLSDQKIGGLSVNPTNPAFILTSSNNRTLKYADFFFLAFHASQGLNADLLVWLCSGSGMYGNFKKFRCVNCRFFFFHWRMISVLTTSEQVQRNGVLELDMQEVGELDKSKGGTATLRADCKHIKAVTSASWDPRGRSIVSTCYDDMLRCM
jgi:WD repeat-containing protein 76